MMMPNKALLCALSTNKQPISLYYAC